MISHAEMIAAVKRVIAFCDGSSAILMHKDELAPTMRAVLAHLERTQWRPIETMPTDGRTVLLYYGDHSLDYFMDHIGETLEFHSHAFEKARTPR